MSEEPLVTVPSPPKFTCPKHGEIEDTLSFWKDGERLEDFCFQCLLEWYRTSIPHAIVTETRRE